MRNQSDHEDGLYEIEVLKEKRKRSQDLHRNKHLVTIFPCTVIKRILLDPISETCHYHRAFDKIGCLQCLGSYCSHKMLKGH